MWARGKSQQNDTWESAVAMLPALIVALLAAAAMTWSQQFDPFVRHDDFPALLGDHEAYYHKTLQEGRWLNYWWIHRPMLASSQVNYLLYFSGWAVFSAAFATNALGTKTHFAWRSALAVLVVVSPQAITFSEWFNTHILSAWLIAVYAVLCLHFTWRVNALLLLLFSPLSFSTYSTQPFILLAVLLTSHQIDRSWRIYLLLGLAFALAFALSVGLSFGLNWIFHDTFGIVIGEWRETYSQNTVLDNLPLISDFLKGIVTNYGLGNEIYGFLVFALTISAFYIVFLHDRIEALFAVTPVFLGMALLFHYALTNGVFIPSRSTIFVWLCSAYALVRVGMIICARNWVGGVLVWLVFALVAAPLIYRAEWNYKLRFSLWQAATMELALLVPQEAEQILVYGQSISVDGALQAGILSNKGLSSRLRYLTGKPTYVCNVASDPCDFYSPPFNLEYGFADHVEGDRLIKLIDGTVFIRLPRTVVLVP